ncbi:sn-glycerol-3-phosphate ABC transporter ATP-binding protein UgpC [soil metagenome]
MAHLRFDGVRKVYNNGVVAVKGASFEVQDGEFVVFVGPSGCGKSTMLRMIAGLETMTEGSLSIDDREVNDVPPKDRDVAMVFQNYALYPHMSIYENLSFGLKVRKFPKTEIAERVRDAAAILGLEEVLDRKPKHLSGGQRQRVAVGRAIVRKPQVFLFDEPLSNLDAKLRVQMRTEIAKLHHRLGTTMIYVTHDQVEAMTLGTRIVVLRDGEIQQIDAPLELYERPANRFVAGFIGSPAMNFIEGTIESSGGGLLFRALGGLFSMELPDQYADSLQDYVGRGITLGVRPEAIGTLARPAGQVPIGVANWTLDVIEPMGNEIVLYASAFQGNGAANGLPISEDPQHRVVARVLPQALPSPGSMIELSFDPDRLYFFDPETEQALAGRTSSTMPEGALA